MMTNQRQKAWQLVAEGLNNHQIAERMQLAEKTVKSHLTEVFKLLGVENRTQAAIAWHACGGKWKAPEISVPKNAVSDVSASLLEEHAP
jgi:DNA-binding CsgD family transcriptional regulator